MEILQPRFMLLPNFRSVADGDIQLGTLLTRDKKTNRPDPNRPLNRIDKLQIPRNDIRSQESQPWSWTSNDQVSGKLGLFAELSLLTGIGGDVSGNRGRNQSLDIKCDRLCTTWFAPNPSYIVRTLEDDNVQPYVKRWIRPPLYMVTGIMVAHNANLEIKNAKECDYEARITVDTTQLQIPIKAGPEGGYSSSRKTAVVETPTGPFILAYQLIRIRAKRNGGFDAYDENKWALFSDEDVEDESMESLLEEFDIDDISAASKWDESSHF